MTAAMDEGDAAESSPPSPAPLRLRGFIGRSLALATSASPRIRGASLYVSLHYLALLAPVVVLVSVIADRRPALVSAFVEGVAFAAMSPDEEAIVSLLGLSFLVVFLGVVALAIECQALAVAVLGSTAVGLPLALREALRRSRQSFWRIFRASLITWLPLVVVGQVASGFLSGILGPATETTALATTALTTVLGVPFAYTVTAIVLGDAGARAAVVRSFRLARAVWRLAFVVALVGAFATELAVFGFGAAIGLVGTVGQAVGLGFGSGPATTFLTLVVTLLIVASAGSLQLTVTAVVAAPQVAAFLGLGEDAAGLDRAREEAGPGAPARVRWVSWPMAAGIAVTVLCSLAGLRLVLDPG